jgi:hypothetical protein
MEISYQRWNATFLLLLLLSIVTLAQNNDCESRRFEGCDSCVAAGCAWCTASAICADAALYVNQTNTLLCDFTTTCTLPPPDAFVFTDPLVESQRWVYDLINVAPVWRAGYSKSSLSFVRRHCLRTPGRHWTNERYGCIYSWERNWHTHQ